MKHILLYFFIISTLFSMEAFCQSKPLTEDDFYELVTIPAPEGVMLEVGGIATLPDGRVAVSTRRGEIWLIENAYMHNQTKPYFKQFALGLHEILGLAYKDGAFYCTQRGELTKITDIDGDEVADLYEPIAKFQLSGNYHEYSYGPVLDKQGNMLVTLNLAWVGYGEGKFAKWRGWLLKISPDGKVEPLATGLRSPAGFNINELGDIFYGENQGDWVGSGRVTHLEKGDFAGNPGGLTWTKEPDSPLRLNIEDIPDTGEPLYKATEKVKSLKLPAVWFPHTLMGISTADILEDNTHSKFGPFEGQYFVADQGHSKVMRMFLEKVKGQYQGVCFPFREGWMSGLLRLRWGIDGSLFGGMTSRGWASTGKASFGLQRLVWTGKVPFEMKAIRAMPDGFEIEFTKPVAKQTAERLSNYDISSFNYKYHHQYGSPVIDNQPCSIQKIVVSDDLLKVRLVVRGIRQYYVHQIKLLGVKAENEEGLLHSVGYYTLNQIPEGDKIDVGVINTMPTHSHHVEKPTVSVKNKPLASLKRANTQPIDWVNGADQVITLGTKPGLMFDTDKIEVKAGSKIKWVFNNNDDMTHNCVIVKPNAANDVGVLALDLGLKGETVSYIPKSANVLFHTGLLQPNSSETIYFVAPAEEGEYQFVCTYPGHFNVMQGVLRVSK